ncbi:MAG: hypothetical protein CMM45_08485 [Rhodospirillaceae bacterium]|nr:hypothetical protein [Rhodospirillaceae bacterium]
MASASTKKRSKKRANPSQLGLEAALRLAGKIPWDRISLADIAAEARMPEDDFRALFPTKLSLLEAYGREVDERVETRGKTISMDEHMKDRLFEAIMIRLDILGVHKDAVASIIRATLRGNPKTIAAGASALRRAMAQLLDLCGEPSGGLCRQFKVRALGLIYFYVLRIWLADDTSDIGKTMAALDKALTRAETIINSLPTSTLHRAQ